MSKVNSGITPVSEHEHMNSDEAERYYQRLRDFKTAVERNGGWAILAPHIEGQKEPDRLDILQGYEGV